MAPTSSQDPAKDERVVKGPEQWVSCQTRRYPAHDLLGTLLHVPLPSPFWTLCAKAYAVAQGMRGGLVRVGISAPYTCIIGTPRPGPPGPCGGTCRHRCHRHRLLQMSSDLSLQPHRESRATYLGLRWHRCAPREHRWHAQARPPGPCGGLIPCGPPCWLPSRRCPAPVGSESLLIRPCQHSVLDGDIQAHEVSTSRVGGSHRGSIHAITLEGPQPCAVELHVGRWWSACIPGDDLLGHDSLPAGAPLLGAASFRRLLFGLLQRGLACCCSCCCGCCCCCSAGALGCFLDSQRPQVPRCLPPLAGVVGSGPSACTCTPAHKLHLTQCSVAAWMLCLQPTAHGC